MQTINIPQIDGEHPIDTAARMLGSRSALADKLGISVAAIGNWKVRGVPLEQCPKIEMLTIGAVTRRHLCPDNWQEIWPELAQAPASNAQAATETIAQGVVNA